MSEERHIDSARSIPEVFRDRVSRSPGGLAIRTQDREITYQELDRQTDQVAHLVLERLGPDPQPVALLFEHDAPQLAAFLGVLKAGKIVVCLDPGNPRTRNSEILEASGGPLLLTDAAHLEMAHRLGGKRAGVVSWEGLPADLPGRRPDPSISPESPATVLFTSGSTGEPKGVVHSHHGWLGTQRGYARDLAIRPSDRLGLIQYCHHIWTIEELLGALLNGASVLPLDPRREGLNRLISWLSREEITWVSMAPTLFRQLVGAGIEASACPRLRYLILGSEPVTRKDFENYRRHFPDSCRLVVAYGASESPGTCNLQLDKDARVERDRLPVGYPLEGKEVLLLDEAGDPVPRGERGEITVRSSYLAIGYWNQPDLTAERFSADSEGKRLYRTGDLGSLRENGCLEYLGRKDSLVKIRGMRVELMEVEAALQNLEGVKQAAVAAHPQDQETRLVAYVVPHPGACLTPRILREKLGERLQEHMIPTRFLLLERLAVTSTGKVDRMMLSPPDWSQRDLASSPLDPRDELEFQVHRVWREVLQMNRIGIQDNFFDLGFDSLTALRLVLEVERIFGRRLPLTELIQAPTIETMTATLRKEGAQKNWPSLVPFTTTGTRFPFFAVHGREGNVVSFYSLARVLGSDQPFYALQAPGLDGFSPTLNRVEDFASHYLREIRQAVPHGPYCLAGFSFGGLVAFEMARRLREEGEEVPFLGLLDSYHPEMRPGWLRKQLGRFSIHVRRLRKLESPAHVLDQIRHRGEATREPPPLAIHAIEAVRRGVNQAVRSYHPGVYQGKMTLFRCHELQSVDYLAKVDMARAWSRCLEQDLEVIRVPGNHNNMMRPPHLQVLAGKIQHCLDQARLAPPGGDATGTVAEKLPNARSNP